MISFNPRNLWILGSVLMVGIAAVHCLSDNCALYNSLDWGNTDINFKKISGIYSVIKTNTPNVFGKCEVHGLVQQVNGDIEDHYVTEGSACVYKNLITKTPTAFQFAFFNDDPNCVPRGATGNMKMKVTTDGSCFFKSFCLPDGTSAVNLLCTQSGVLDALLQSVIDLLLSLLGGSFSAVSQSCNNETVRQQVLS